MNLKIRKNYQRYGVWRAIAYAFWKIVYKVQLKWEIREFLKD